MANPNPQHYFRLKMLVRIEDHGLYTRYDLNRTALPNLRLDILRDGLEILHDCMPFLAVEARQLHRSRGGKEIHVEPGLYSLIDTRSTYGTSLRHEVIRVHFVPDAAPLQHGMNIGFANIGCHTVADAIYAPSVH